MFYAFVFNEGIPITEAEYVSIQNIVADYRCDTISDKGQKDIILNFTFDYPFVDFTGILLISASLFPGDNTSEKVLYTGTFHRTIVLKDLCYSRKDSEGIGIGLHFLFVTEKKIYEWYSTDPFPVSRYHKMKVHVSYDDHISSNRAFIIPVE
jgi:hypothetical protein